MPIVDVEKLPIKGVERLTSRGVKTLPIRDDDGGLLNRDGERVPMDRHRRVLNGDVGRLPIDDIGKLPI